MISYKEQVLFKFDGQVQRNISWINIPNDHLMHENKLPETVLSEHIYVLYMFM